MMSRLVVQIYIVVPLIYDSHQDPDFLRKLYSQVSSITTRLLSQHSEVAFTVLEHCMNLRNMVGPGNDMYLEVGKDLIETGAYVAQRLGATFADQFLVNSLCPRDFLLLTYCFLRACMTNSKLR